MTAVPPLTITAGLNARLERDTTTAAAVSTLAQAIMAGADMRKPPAPWRASYPLDDPENFAPDLWIAKLPAGDVWCKSDGGHDNVEPAADGTCTWCGALHDEPRPLFTFMDPSDY